MRNALIIPMHWWGTGADQLMARLLLVTRERIPTEHVGIGAEHQLLAQIRYTLDGHPRKSGLALYQVPIASRLRTNWRQEMARKRDSEDRVAGLRTRAGQTLNRSQSDEEDISSFSPRELRRLIHELRVQQIELEKENEELRQAQDELAESGEKYQDLFDLFRVGSMKLNEKGLILEADLIAAQLLGMDRKKLTKMFLSHFVTEEFVDSWHLYLQRIFETRSKQTCIMKLIREDGTLFYGLLESVSVQDETGGYNRCCVIVSDITEPKKMQEERDRILNRSYDLICVAGMDGYFKYVNPSWERVLGYTTEELLSRPCLDFIHPEDHVKNDEEVRKLKSGQPTVDFENRYIHKNGSVMTINWTATPVPEKGIMYCVGRAVTGRTRTKEALDLMKSAIESSISGICIAELDGNLTYVNGAALRLWGYDREEEVLGKRATGFWLTGKEAEEAVGIAAKTGAWIGELVAKTKDGTLLDVQAIITLVRDSDSKPMAIMGSFLDISQHKRDREALRESEERYRRFVETANEGVWATDEDLRTTFVNRKMAEMLGYAPEEMLGKTPYSFMFEEDLPEQHRRAERRRRGQGETYERRFKCKDGSEAWMLVSATPSLDQDGNFHGSFGMLTDITETRKAAAEVKQQRDFLQQLIDTIPAPIFYKDMEGKYLGCNTAYEADVGMSRADIVGKTVFDVAPPDLAQIYHEQDLSLFRNPAIQQGETIRQDAAGMRHEVFFTKAPFWDLEGNIAGVVGAIFYITELKRTQAALQSQISFMESMLEAMPAPVSFKNTDHVYLGCNEAFAKLMGLTKENVIGKTVFDIAPKELAEVYHADDKALFERSGSQVYESSVQSSDGTMHDLVVHKATFADSSGQVAGLIGVMLDISERKCAEDALKESERRYRLLADNTLDVIWQVDLDLAITYVNPAITRLTGHSVDEWIGTKLNEHCDEENFAKLAQVAQEEISKGPDSRGTIIEAELLKKNKEPVEVEIHGKVILGEDGLPVRLQGVTRDITDRKRAEKALRQSQEELKTIFETSPAAMFLVNTEGSVTFANQRMADLFSIPVEDLPSTPYVELVHPKERSVGYGEMQALMSGEIDLVSLDRGYVRPDGIEFLGHLSGRRLKRPDGGLEGVVGIIEDITDRKRAEEALRESEQRYRAVVDNLQIGISIINRKMEIMAVNPFFKAYYPDVHPGTGQICYSSYNDPPRSSPCSYCPCVLTFQDGEVHECETDTPAGGKIRNYRIISCPVKDERGEVEFVIELVEDVTEKRSLYSQLAQAQKMEAIGTLAGGIAHDFNNILQLALGYSEMVLNDDGLHERLKPDLKKIYESSRRGADLVKRLLAFSRKTEINLQPLDLNHRTKEMGRMIERTIPKMIEIEMFLEEDLARVNADPTQIDQILMNLALNARDAMPEGGKLIVETANTVLDEEYVKTNIEATPGTYVQLTVTDTGPGMDEETLEHIFEPFYTTKGVGEGTGLGLAMVHGIVKQHGGHITCDSEPGKGTTFKIYLPAIVQEIEQDVADTREMPAFGTETILLVDDEESIRKLGERMLRMAGYTVLTATNGREALEIYRSNQDRIGLVLLDLIMPEMGGKQCLEELLKINPRVNVVIASGYSANGPAKDAPASGAKGFVNKPFQLKDLLCVVRRTLDASGSAERPVHGPPGSSAQTDEEDGTTPP